MVSARGIQGPSDQGSSKTLTFWYMFILSFYLPRLLLFYIPSLALNKKKKKTVLTCLSSFLVGLGAKIPAVGISCLIMKQNLTSHWQSCPPSYCGHAELSQPIPQTSSLLFPKELCVTESRAKQLKW